MTHILIDTDVILDFFFDRKPYSENAAQVLSLCESKQITGYITPVILSNAYYLLRKNGQHNLAIEKLKSLISIIDILIIDKNSIMNALTSDFNDFEDALQNYAAEKNKEISLIITRNTKDFKNSSIGAMTPEDFLTLRSL
jgi:predicted nucleic acid-binding protein